jgi:PAS domain S-box-containing protein
VSLLAWLVTVFTLAVFITAIIPEQKRELEESLRAKAASLAVSAQSLIAMAAVSDDYSQVVDHALQVIEGDPAIVFLVVTRNDGYSLRFDRRRWRAETLDAYWRPAERTTTSEIGRVPVFDLRAFRYSRPLDYSGIPWGWIHVGLTLESYDRGVARLSRRMAQLGTLCVGLALAVSVGYARRLVRPVLNMQDAMRKVAEGDLGARAEVANRDELGRLAAAFNAMAATIQERNQMLESVSFAAQRLLSAEDWREAIVEVLHRVGRAAGAHRAHIDELHRDAGGRLVLSTRYEWAAEGVNSTLSRWQRRPVEGSWMADVFSALKRGEAATYLRSRMSPEMRGKELGSTDAPDLSRWCPSGCRRNGGGGYLAAAFSNCEEERAWTEFEMAGLRVVAKALGAAIARQRATAALAEANETLERRVAERTRELEEAQALLAQNLERLDLALDGAEEALWDWNLGQKRAYYSERWSRMLGYEPEEIEQTPEIWRRLIHPEDAPGVKQKFQAHLRGDTESYEAEFRMKAKDGGWRWIRSRGKIVARSADGAPLRVVGTHVDITANKQAEESMLALSRRAGMAEVATGVLHNVGNVLNSVNVAATIVSDRIQGLRVSNLAPAVEMLRAHTGTLDRFLSEDPKGRRLLPYLGNLATHLISERDLVVEELTHLTRHIGHIKEIVAMQQTYARTSGLVERLAASTLFEDALRIVQASYERHEIRLRREYEELPEIATDRHKVLQILLNLLRNAKDALKAANDGPREVTVRLKRAGENRFRFQVADNGSGIDAEHLAKIFSHGFTTKPGGHGFGLHSGALAARQLGGSLVAESAGLGRGAVFTLELPLVLPAADGMEMV